MAESTLTAIMGRMSAYTGKAVTWEQALNSQQNLMPENLTWDMPAGAAGGDAGAGVKRLSVVTNAPRGPAGGLRGAVFWNGVNGMNWCPGILTLGMGHPLG